MIKQFLQFISGMQIGNSPDTYTAEDCLIDFAILAYVVFFVWKAWP